MTRRMGRNFHAFLKGVKRTATEVERDTSGEPSQNKKKLKTDKTLMKHEVRKTFLLTSQ